uniref:Bifunctional epoxide hydrolase 2 n=1 Tax=Bos indicus x Bos taurus TaxID=30522 RepID=A0A4W2EUG6_BOBOX
MALRAAVFELGGILTLPSATSFWDRAEEELALPGGFLSKAFLRGGPDGPSIRVMKGEITFSQWVPFMEEDCRKCSKDCGICLPENFSIKQIFEKILSSRKINYPMLQAAVTLKQKGFTTCILTNTWLDDSTERGSLAQVLCELKPHFDFLIESCQIGMVKPDPQIYKFVLDTLKISPSEVVFLDNFETNLKPAHEMGMVTIFVHDTDAALKELEKVTGVQPGVRLHFVELGSGPVVCLCHGFPESWFSWRYQIPALAQAGFRVLAVDMKGYGESSAPPEIEEYSLEVLSKDMITFLDKLGISQAVFIGHDWGGMLVWTIALFHPERVRAVASLNTPFMPSNPKVSTMEIIKATPTLNYQLYFQEPGVAEAELEKNLSRTFKSFFRSNDETFITVSRTCEMGGLLVNTPEEPTLSKMVTEEDIQFYVQEFKKSGFRGPLNWYRNMDKNWEWGFKGSGRKVSPTLFSPKSPSGHPWTPLSWSELGVDRLPAALGSTSTAEFLLGTSVWLLLLEWQRVGQGDRGLPGDFTQVSQWCPGSGCRWSRATPRDHKVEAPSSQKEHHVLSERQER